MLKYQKTEVREQTAEKKATWYCQLISFFVFCLLISVTCGCQNRQVYKVNRVLMGTFVEVASSDKGAADIVFKEIARIERLLSKYVPESEISRLNKNGAVNASPETLYILDKAKEFCRLSEGAFDVTVAPLVDLWGFTDKQYRLPQEAQILQARKFVGSENMILLRENNVVKLRSLGVKIDLGAIAKGYAVDCAVGKLREAGVKNCLIAAGGQIYCLGSNSGKPWKIAIRSCQGKGLAGYLKLKDQAVSTSGGYEQYFVVKDKYYSHIIDPRTGYPASSGIASVTVVASDGLTADALSTAIYVLGKEKGMLLAAKFPAVEVKIMDNQ